MKKDRNSFFSQYGVSAYNTQPFMYPNMQQGMQASSMQASNMQASNMQPFAQPFDNTSEMDARISKLEREIQRLDARITKLESSITPTVTNTDYNFANSMYMV